MTYIPQTPVHQSAFGDSLASQLKPIVSMKATYGLLDNVETFTATGGSVTVADGMFVLQTGTSVGGYGVAWSRQPIVYQPGVGVEARGTVGFTTPVANSLQLFGLFSSVDGMFFGYNGTSFGVMHRYAGEIEVRVLTVDTASNANTTVTVVLNGVSYSGLAVTNSGVASTTAHELTVALEATAAADAWYIQHIDDTIVFTFKGAGAQSGAYSATPAAGAFVGTFSQTKAGAAPTEAWTAQASWNGDTCSWLDTTKVNLFRLSFAYLGFGPLRYEVLNPSTGRWVTCHTIQWGNAYTTPNFRNPSMRVGYASASMGSSTNLTVRGANAAAFLQGQRFDGRTFGADGTQSGVTTETQVLTIQVRREFGARACNAVLLPKVATLTTDSTKGAVFTLYRNATVAGTTNHQYIDQNQSIALVDTAGTTVSGGRVLADVAVGPQGRTTVDLDRLGIPLIAGDELVITARVVSGAAAEMSAAVTWEEIV